MLGLAIAVLSIFALLFWVLAVISGFADKEMPNRQSVQTLVFMGFVLFFAGLAFAIYAGPYRHDGVLTLAFGIFVALCGATFWGFAARNNLRKHIKESGALVDRF